MKTLQIFAKGKRVWFVLLVLMALAPVRMKGQETITIGYTCDFETYSSTTNLPEGWSRPVGNNATFPMVQYSASYAHGDNCSLRFNGSVSASPQIAVLPQIGESIFRKRLSFYAKRTNDFTLSVGYMADPTDASTFVEVALLSLTNTYQLYSVDFGVYDGDPRYLAIRSNSTYTSQNYYIDDLSLSLAPPLKPVIQNSVASSNSATVEWTVGGNETAWDIYYSTSAVAPTDETTPSMSNIGTSNCTVNGLTEATNYYFWVRANCGTEFSDWSGPAVFTTPSQGQTALTVCYGERTNSMVPTSISVDYLCKTEFVYPASMLSGVAGREIQGLTFQTSQTYPYNKGFYRVFLKEVGADNFGESNVFFGTEGASIVYEGPLSVDANGLMDIDFEIPFVYSGASNSNLLVGIYKAKTFGAGSYTYPWFGKVMPKAAVCGINYSYQAQLDDITTGNKFDFLPRITFVHQEPTPCPKPARIVVSNVTAHTAEISWAARDDQDLWEIYYTTTEPTVAPNANTQPNIDNITTNPFLWNNLNSETTYYAYLRSNCGAENGTSEWSDVFSFTTTVSCFAPSNLHVTALDGTSATLEWTPGVEGQSLWEVYLTNDASDVPDANTTPTHSNLSATSLTLTGFIPENTYYAYVRANCGSEDGVSFWSPVCVFKPTETTQVTVHDGTKTNTVIPVRGGLNYYGKSEFVIPAAELVAMQGTYLTSLKFYGNESSPSWENTVSFDVFVKEVNFTQYASQAYSGQEGATMVYQGKMKFNSSKEMTVTFTTPYYYEGGNLLVGFYSTNITSSSNAQTVTWKGETMDNYTAVSGSASSSTSSYSCTRYQFLPKTTFTYSNMLAPINLGMTYVGMHTAIMRWNPDPVYTGLITGWEVVYSTEAGFNPYNATPIAINDPEGTSISMSDMTPSTQYYAYVRAKNGDVHGPWSDCFTFRTTEYDPVVINDDNPYYFDGFDDETFDWSVETGGANRWVRGRGSWVTKPYSMYVSCSHSCIINTYYVSNSYAYKTFELEGGKEYEVSFDWRFKPLHDTQDRFYVFLVPAGTVFNTTSYSPSLAGWQSLSESSLSSASIYTWHDSYYRFEIPEGEGGSYAVVFYWHNDNYGTSDYYWPNLVAIDNFLLNVYMGEAPRPVPPTPEPTEVTIEWEPSEIEPTAWQIIYSTNPDLDPYTLDLSEFPDNLPEDVVGVEYVKNDPSDPDNLILEGLDPETGYYVYVRAIYPPIKGAKDDVVEEIFSRWSEKITFTTGISCYSVENLQATDIASDNATLTWSVSDQQGVANMPETWNVRYKKDVQEGTTTTYTFDNGQNPAELVQGWRVMEGSLVSEGFADTVWVAFPIQLPCVVGFDAKGIESNVSFTAMVCADVEGEEVLASRRFTAAEGVSQSMTFDVSNREGTCYLVFSKGYNAPVAIDNLTLDVPVWTYATANGNTFTLDGLEAGNRYLFAVQAHCGEGDDSQWETTVFEVEPCSPDERCSINYTLNDSYGDGWNGANIVVKHGTTTVAVLEMLDDFTLSDELLLCPDLIYTFSWVSGRYDEECSFSITYFDSQGAHVYSSTETPSEGIFLSFDMACPIENTFIAESGDWNVAANWSEGVVPTPDQIVVIEGNCSLNVDAEVVEVSVVGDNTLTIESGKILTSNTVTTRSPEQLVIKDGGQLNHANISVQAMVEKEIAPYSPNGTNGKTDGWYLITPPATQFTEFSNWSWNAIHYEDVANLTANTYDLYRFDSHSEGQEWQNFKNPDHNVEGFLYLYPMEGYLYANSGNEGNGVTLQFAGEINPVDETTEDNPYVLALEGSEDGNETRAGWTLIGNPLACNAYLVEGSTYKPKSNRGSIWLSKGNMPYFRMNETRTDIVIANEIDREPILVGEGVFVFTEVETKVRFSVTPYEEPGPTPKKGGLALNISQNRGGVIDRAVIRFGEDRQLPKFQLNPNHTKVYIPRDHKEYTVVGAEAQGEIPVNFKAEKNGTYTISFSTENVEFGYLHLIDNLTGNDIDLLSTPGYSFEARTDDYASRFKLVFATGDVDDDHFAFIGNGEIILGGVSGNTTVQLFDVTGRMLFNDNGANRISVENMAAGVYVIRLVNGNDVKTQKIVIK